MAKKLGIFGGFFLIAGILSLCLGSVLLTPGQLWQALREGPRSTAGYILWYVRMPRTLASLCAGAALAVSGAVVQNVLRNSLASPGIIGINAGAGLAVTVCVALGVVTGWVVAGAAFLGAMGAALAVVTVAQKVAASRKTVVLGGVAVNAFLNALSEAVVALVPETAALAGDFRVGGFASVSLPRLIPAVGMILPALAVLMTLHNELDLLALGEEMAQGLGMNVKKTRRALLLLAALLAGAAVSFGGLLGFVGLVVPHGVRKWAGGENRLLLPLCALGGGGFVTVCDTAARVLFAPYELPVGILLSALGGPCFLYLLAKQKGGRKNA